ncbi:hypothetical protein BT96DRAFT_1000274 [Gymnopus androsaceus JB14]|uniref:Uncharacterized protein n=1 Tax=Gymnopus androsaceus JB14 TaxID=1447944 RepID=A0A6A4H436_9AGAR|nr:hypothetical protein BT96DRAFT_1000274 [Gymnopus androsaceus JB14]
MPPPPPLRTTNGEFDKESIRDWERIHQSEHHKIGSIVQNIPAKLSALKDCQPEATAVLATHMIWWRFHALTIIPLDFIPRKSLLKKICIHHKPYTQHPAPKPEVELTHIWVGTKEGALLLPKLKAFDRNPEYGPNSGLSHLMHWEQAVSLGLSPPAELGPYLVEIDKDLLHPWRMHVFHPMI